jgi:hypothetical protein
MKARQDQGPNGILITSGPEAALAVGPGARLPIPVMLLWLCAFAGLAAYTASCYVPSLAQLGK